MENIFDSVLTKLSDIDWNKDYVILINRIMDEIIYHPFDFAAYLEKIIKENKEDLIEQSKGILFFMVYRNPEIFILIYRYIKNFRSESKRLLMILEGYNYLIKES